MTQFIQTQRTVQLNGSIIVGGVTVEVADTFVVNENVKQVAAPIAPVVVRQRVAPAPVIADGTVRTKTNITLAGQIVAAGTQFPPTGAQPTPSRATIATSINSRGTEEALYEVWNSSAGQWQAPTNGKSR